MPALAVEASTVVDLLTAFLAVGTAAGAGLWAVYKYLADRRAARAQQERLADRELSQRQVEEARARQQRAAELVKAVGEATDDRGRRWTMTALSLYADEALDLLLHSLGEATEEDASAIKLAVISIGPSALPKTVRAHRIARQICRTAETEGAPGNSVSGQRRIDATTAGAVRDCTREIILQLIFQLSESGRETVDLAHVDLSHVGLSGARLSRLHLRKTRLDGAVMVRASLNRAVLRGATLNGAALRGAHLRGADLTGCSGAVHAIGADLTGATLDHARLDGSDFSGAVLRDATLEATGLQRATLCGAALGGVVLQRTRLRGAAAAKLKGSHLRAEGADFSHADLSEAVLTSSAFTDQCSLVRVEATGCRAHQARFVDARLAGGRFDRAILSGVTMLRCNLGGTAFRGADLRGAVLTDCLLAGTDLAGADLKGARFERCRLTGSVDFTGVDLTGVRFSGCTIDARARLFTDNGSWREIEDEAVRAAFDPDASAPTGKPSVPATQ